MTCLLCSNKAVFSSPKYCKKHFSEYIEEKVLNAIMRFKLIKKKDKVAVAVSGGKDSLTVLNILNKHGYDVTALAIDEGIEGYRDNTLRTLKKFCEDHNVPLQIYTFKKNFGNTLDEALNIHSERPCTMCGVFRRYLLNKYSQDFDVLATGHNLDDEAQGVLMNLIKGNITLLKRQGPVSGIIDVKKFTKRVKPLYLCTEKEIMTYSFLNDLTTDFKECPNVRHAFRLRVRDMLNEIEMKRPGTKKNIIGWFLNYKKNVKTRQNSTEVCERCGQPSTGKICNTCRFVMKINA